MEVSDFSLPAGVGAVGVEDDGLVDGAAVRDVMAGVRAGLRSLALTDRAVLAGMDLPGLVGELEAVSSSLDSLKCSVMVMLEVDGWHGRMGLGSGRFVYRHVAQISGVLAFGLFETSVAMRELSICDWGYRRGVLGVDQARRIGRLWGNPVYRAPLRVSQDRFMEWAGRLSFKDFERRVDRWCRQIDAMVDTETRTEHTRAASMRQNRDGSWMLSARLGSVTGAKMKAVLHKFCEGEFNYEWSLLSEQYGPDLAPEKLRTVAQRRADALFEIFDRAAAYSGGAKGMGVTTIIKLDPQTFERWLTSHGGGDPGPDTPGRDSFCCETIDGDQLNVDEACSTALVNAFRRAVVSADGVTLDLGEKRFFTGFTRLAVQINHNTCTGMGCEVPTTQCQIDHHIRHADRGGTNPNNGVPRCGIHNRDKEKRRRIPWRDQNGSWWTSDPGGTNYPGPPTPKAP